MGEKRKMKDMVEFLKGCPEHSFPVGFDRDLLYPPDVVNWNMDNAKAIANEITTSSMLMSSTTASSTSPCPKKRKISSNLNTNNTNNVVVNAPFDSSSFSYDGIINPLKTTISQHPQQHQQQQQPYQQHQQPQQQHQQTSSTIHPLPSNAINNNGIYNIKTLPENGLSKQQIPLTSDFLQNPQQNPQHQLQTIQLQLNQQHQNVQYVYP